MATEAFRRSTECASVPLEGRTLQFDARTGKGEGPSVFFLRATRCGKGGGNSREDGDYHVEDFAPESVVVEGSHFE